MINPGTSMRALQRVFDEPERIVIVGSGFGGYFAARRLGRKLRVSRAQISIISDADSLLYQPLLPEVAVGALDPRSVAVPISTLKRVHLVRGHVRAIDIDAKVISVITPSGTEGLVPYDRLVLAAGGVTRVSDTPGVREHALGFKTVAEAMYLRDLVLRRMEQANDEEDPATRRKLLSFVVVGGGYAGTELVAQMARLSRSLLRRFPSVSADDVRWMLLSMSTSVMPELGVKLALSATNVLLARGVDVRFATSVREVTARSALLTDGTVVDGATVVWCAGVAANPIATTSGLPTQRGRLLVDPDLRVPGHPDVYGIGDAAAVPDLRGRPDSTGAYPLCPPTAQHAMRQGRAVARNVVADVLGRGRRNYRHRDLGTVVDLGGSKGVARPLGIPLRGLAAKIVARGYHIYALPTLRRRLRALAGWALAGRVGDDVAFGWLPSPSVLAAGEHVLQLPALPGPAAGPVAARSSTGVGIATPPTPAAAVAPAGAVPSATARS